VENWWIAISERDGKNKPARQRGKCWSIRWLAPSSNHLYSPPVSSVLSGPAEEEVSDENGAKLRHFLASSTLEASPKSALS